MLAFFEWCEATLIGQVVRDSVWLFPAIESVHLLGLCLLGGSILVVDLRLLGVALTRRPIAELATGARGWVVASLALMVATGLPLFLSEAVKCYYNTSFWVKMAALPVAVGFTFAVRDRLARRPEVDTSARTRLVGLASVALWFTVAAAGRWIGFSS